MLIHDIVGLCRNAILSHAEPPQMYIGSRRKQTCHWINVNRGDRALGVMSYACYNVLKSLLYGWLQWLATVDRETYYDAPDSSMWVGWSWRVGGRLRRHRTNGQKSASAWTFAAVAGDDRWWLRALCGVPSKQPYTVHIHCMYACGWATASTERLSTK